jgi:hypothetical protein
MFWLGREPATDIFVPCPTLEPCTLERLITTPGLQQHQLRDVPAVERHRANLGLGNDVGDRARRRFHERGGAFDRDRFGHVAERQSRVDDGLLADR